MKQIKLLARTIFTMFFLVFTFVAAEGRAAVDPQAELDAAYQAASSALVAGPAEVPLAGQAVMQLPAGYGFIPVDETRRLLEAMGNRVGEGLAGMIVSMAEQEAGWFMVASYTESGFIKDDDARDWDADELLENIRAGTEEANNVRRARGIPEMEIIGWVEKPQYDAANHRLAWSIASRDKGPTADQYNGVNYNTLALGRQGYISMNLVTDLAFIEDLKPVAKNMLAALDFNEGKRYADFSESTDKVAEYGLAALVAGVAAKKLGFFALLAVFAAKFAKVIGVVAVAGAGILVKVMKGRRADRGTA